MQIDVDCSLMTSLEFRGLKVTLRYLAHNVLRAFECIGPAYV